MEMQIRAVSSVGVLLMLIFGVIWLKRIGLLKDEYGQMCSVLVTKVTLPALIFVTLLHADFNWNYGKMTIVLLSSSIVCFCIGWLIARAFRIDRPGTAPVILAASWSSSMVLGVPVIGELYPEKKELVVETIVMTGIGRAPLMIAAGTLIALYYGTHELDPRERRKATFAFFRSPIFIAMISGVVFANITNHDNSVVHSFLDGFRIVSAGNTLMVVLMIGLLVQLDNYKGIIGITICVVSVNMILLPFLLLLQAHAIDIPHWQIEVLTLEGAMPAVPLSVALCHEYGGDSRLAAKLVFATLVASIFTVPVIFTLARML